MLIAASATAQQAPEDLSGLLPASGEVAGLTLSDTPQGYRGDDLYQMIDGGADIYHEYGFRQVLSAEYVDGRGKIIKLEMYEMESPAAAYGIYSFKVGEGGKALAIGQEALLEDYYLNFWKGNLQVTLIGQDCGGGDRARCRCPRQGRRRPHRANGRTARSWRICCSTSRWPFPRPNIFADRLA